MSSIALCKCQADIAHVGSSCYEVHEIASRQSHIIPNIVQEHA
jgi:hypothetical protein